MGTGFEIALELIGGLAIWLVQIVAVVGVSWGFFRGLGRLLHRLGFAGSEEHNEDRLRRIRMDVLDGGDD